MTEKLKSDFSEAIALIHNSITIIVDDEELSSYEINSLERSIDELKADKIRIFYSFNNAKRYLKGNIPYKLQAPPNISSVRLSMAVRSIAAGGLTTTVRSIAAGGLAAVIGTITTGGLAALQEQQQP